MPSGFVEDPTPVSRNWKVTLPVDGLTRPMYTPAVVVLPKPLPKMIAQSPLCRRAMIGEPTVFPRCDRPGVALLQSPITRLEALLSEKLEALVISRA